MSDTVSVSRGVHRRSSQRRRSAFSLIELCVSIGIAAVILAVMLPNLSLFDDQQEANQTALRLAARVREMITYSVRMGTWTYFTPVNQHKYQIVYGYTDPTTGPPPTTTFALQYIETSQGARAKVINPTAGQYLVISPRGWVEAGTGIIAPPNPPGPTNYAVTVDPSEGNYYPIAVTDGGGTYVYTVRVLLNGRVVVR